MRRAILGLAIHASTRKRRGNQSKESGANRKQRISVTRFTQTSGGHRLSNLLADASTTSHTPMGVNDGPLWTSYARKMKPSSPTRRSKHGCRLNLEPTSRPCSQIEGEST